MCTPFAPASDAAKVPLRLSPQAVFTNTLTTLKEAVDNNFIVAFFVIASAAMGMHYEAIINTYGMCPTAVAIGPKNTGKSTAARTALALLGTQ